MNQNLQLYAFYHLKEHTMPKSKLIVDMQLMALNLIFTNFFFNLHSAIEIKILKWTNYKVTSTKCIVVLLGIRISFQTMIQCFALDTQRTCLLHIVSQNRRKGLLKFRNKSYLIKETKLKSCALRSEF